MSKSKYAHGNRKLVGRLLKCERGLKGYIPTPRPDGPPEPVGADEVLAALSATYNPGDVVGLRQILSCIAISQVHATAVRRWAQHRGAWPYLQPGIGRPAAGSGRRRRRKDGAS